MATHDTKGRPYARFGELKPGDQVIVDGGFGCMEPWSTRTVQGGDPDLSIPCKCGSHSLEGQLDLDGSDALVGVYRAEGFVR